MYGYLAKHADNVNVFFGNILFWIFSKSLKNLAIPVKNVAFSFGFILDRRPIW